MNSAPSAEGRAPMTLAQITQDMNEGERARFAAAKERIRRLAAGSHWEDWQVIGDGLLSVRTATMRHLRISAPKGRPYNEAFGNTCSGDPDFASIDSSVRAHLL